MGTQVVHWYDTRWMDWSGLGDLAFSVSSLLAVAELQSCRVAAALTRLHGMAESMKLILALCKH